MAPPPKAASGLSGLFGAFTAAERRTKKPDYPRGVEPLPDAIAEILIDTAVYNSVDQAIGILKNDINARLGAMKIDLTKTSAATDAIIADSVKKVFASATSDPVKQQQLINLGEKLAERITRSYKMYTPETGATDPVEVKVNPSDYGKFIANPRGYIDKVFDEFAQERERNKKLKRAYDVLKGGNSVLETGALTIVAASSGLAPSTAVAVAGASYRKDKGEFRSKIDEIINNERDADQKARLTAFRDQLDKSGMLKTAGAIGKFNSWLTFSRARTQDQTFWLRNVTNLGFPLSIMLTGEVPGLIGGVVAPTGISGYGAFAGVAQWLGKTTTTGQYGYQKGATGPKYVVSGEDKVSGESLSKAVSDAEAAYQKALRGGDQGEINSALAALNNAKMRQQKYGQFLASPGDSVRLYNQNGMGVISVVDDQGNPIGVAGLSQGKVFAYHFYALHPKQWIDGLISGKQWARLISLQNSQYKWAQDLGFRAERFMSGQFYQTFLKPYYSLIAQVRGGGIKALSTVLSLIQKLFERIRNMLLKVAEGVIRPVVSGIAKILLKLGLNSAAAALTAGGSLIVTFGYEALNFVTFGALDKIVLKGLKAIIDLTVIAVLLVLGAVLLCVGAIATIGPQALQGVGSQWVPVGGATIVFTGPAGPVRPVGGFVCPFGSGGLRCTQGPYGCFSHAQCSNGTTGGGTCRSYEYAVDISLPLGAQIVAPEAGRVARSGDMACAIPPGASSIGGYIEFVGAQTGMTYKFFHVRGSATGQVNAGAPIGVVSMPAGGPNRCWTGAHSHSSVSGQNAERFYTTQPVNACQFSCGAPNCTPTN